MPAPVLLPPHPIPPSPPTLFSALRSLFLHISTHPGDKGTISPKAFIDKLKESKEDFRSTMHQDAHEFLNHLLNMIVEEIEDEKKSAQNTAPGEDRELGQVYSSPRYFLPIYAWHLAFE